MKKFTPLLLILLFYCSPPVQFEIIPHQNETPPATNTSLQAIAERVKQSESGFVRFSETETPLWAAGYVISSDTGGNFYKELYLQDKPKNAALGMRLLLDQTALHTRFGVGEKLLFKLNGLGAGYHQGVLSLGGYRADGIGSISESQMEAHLIRTDQKADIQPEPVAIADISPVHVGKLIALDAVQFGKGELDKTFAGEAYDTYDGERRLVSCIDQNSLFLSSSSFAKFKSVVIDSLSGNCWGVLTRDYYNQKYVLKINTPHQIDFQHPRCDLFFEMPFETVALGKFEKKGWHNFIEKGSVYWEVYEDANALGQSLRIGAYRSGDKTSVCWLVTPRFDLTVLTLPQLAFRTSTAFADKSVLEVFYSTNFDGTQTGIKKAKWMALKATLASDKEDDLLWIDSKGIALPQHAEVAIAFRYTGAGKSNSDGTFELDDIRIFEGHLDPQ